MDESNSTSVIIYTAQHRLTGRIALLPGSRLTDYVLNAGPFVAIVEVEIATSDGTPLFQVDFLDLATNRIELIMPADQVTQST
jgi:hypothetical protein